MTLRPKIRPPAPLHDRFAGGNFTRRAARERPPNLRNENFEWADNPFHRLDQYQLSHLAAPSKAGRAEDLHRLLAMSTASGRNAWFEAQDETGQAAGYVADLDIAWSLADEATARTPSRASIGMQFRYALVSGSFRSLVENVPPELFFNLVRCGLWQPSRALAYVANIPDAGAAISAVFPLIMQFSDADRMAGARLAVSLAAHLDEESRLKMLTLLGGFLPSEERLGTFG